MNEITQKALAKLPEILTRDLDQNLCTCNEVLKIKIIEAIASGAMSVEEVRRQTYATDGSACCKQQVARLVECIWE
ncbi:(2Fe-2S)-binding protein [Catenovulum sp. 2E275]|uniref:(2Fe-2S)-binding protein n=1 Tax=Catenovulum sp. 2E275 TaxID=2980497 RepID=UPI0021D1422A|nr:(2Fe-2S)-binding protein [Catenovulum sp. 2E275]MCU4674604.1 (2Fe-2S)-binding protein [Catenovulum sp. 2E275]